MVVDVDAYTKRFADEDVLDEGRAEYWSVSDDSVVLESCVYMRRFDDEVSDVSGDNWIPDMAYETEMATVNKPIDIVAALLAKAIL